MRVAEISFTPCCRQIRLRVEMPDPEKYLTSHVPHLPKLLFQILPRLSEHTCHNDHGLSFREECRNTEIPHLFEHLIIELQLQARQRPSDLLRGETEWNWTRDPKGCYVVYVDYDNELLALGAIRLAERIIRSLDERDLSLDVDAEITRLRELMKIGDALLGGSAPSAATSQRRAVVSRRRPTISRTLVAKAAA